MHNNFKFSFINALESYINFWFLRSLFGLQYARNNGISVLVYDVNAYCCLSSEMNWQICSLLHRWSAEFGACRSGSPEIHDMLADYIYSESPESVCVRKFKLFREKYSILPHHNSYDLWKISFTNQVKQIFLGKASVKEKNSVLEFWWTYGPLVLNFFLSFVACNVQPLGS